MAVVPAQFLQNVQTYQKANLAFLSNQCPFVKTTNTKYKEFQKLAANLGDVVTFDKPTRFVSTNSLIAQFQPANQRVQSLKVDQQRSVSYAFTAQQMLFNVDEYMANFGKGATAELGSKVEANVALNCVTNTYRFYGDGVTPINSYGQLSQALAFFRNYGNPRVNTKGYLLDMAVPSIVNSGLAQFAPNRNNESANSWEIGSFNQCEWYTSNLLPTHIAGNVGENHALLTVVSTTTNPDGAVTAITFSVAGGPGVDANSVKKYDKFYFIDIPGFPNLRFRTFVGHEVSSCPVQFAATEDAASDGSSHVTVTCNPPLQALATSEQNLNVPIQAGMQAYALPSHRAGLLTSGDPLYLAMPQLPNQYPFPTSSEADPDTGVSFRLTYGSLLGENTQGLIHDCIFGTTMVQEYAMALIFPL